MVAFNFNAQNFVPQYAVAGGGLPVGTHPVTITDTTWVQNSKQNGQYLSLTLTCYDGPAKGQQQTDRLNLDNPSKQTVDIAAKQLAAYAFVCGIGGFNDTQELHGKPFLVVIGNQATTNVDAQGNIRQYTEVKDLRKLDGSELPKPGGGQATHTAPPATGFGGPPSGAQPGNPPPPAGQAQAQAPQSTGQWSAHGGPGAPPPAQQWGGQVGGAPPAGQPQGGPPHGFAPPQGGPGPQGFAPPGAAGPGAFQPPAGGPPQGAPGAFQPPAGAPAPGFAPPGAPAGGQWQQGGAPAAGAGWNNTPGR